MGKHQKLLVAIAGVVVLTMMNRINGQSVCNVAISGLVACEPAVTPPNPTPPSSGCCSALTNADFGCLCSYKHSSLLPALGIDPNLAIQLPAICNIPHPPKC